MVQEKEPTTDQEIKPEDLDLIGSDGRNEGSGGQDKESSQGPDDGDDLS